MTTVPEQKEATRFWGGSVISRRAQTRGPVREGGRRRAREGSGRGVSVSVCYGVLRLW